VVCIDDKWSSLHRLESENKMNLLPAIANNCDQVHKSTHNITLNWLICYLCYSMWGQTDQENAGNCWNRTLYMPGALLVSHPINNTRTLKDYAKNTTRKQTVKNTKTNDTDRLLFLQHHLHAKEVQSAGRHSSTDHRQQHSFQMSLYLHVHTSQSMQ